MLEQTLSIIKPDVVGRHQIGAVIARLEASGLRVVALKMLRLSRAEAESFYAEHRERPFFASLIEFMTSGPVVVQVLEGEDAIAANRRLMGDTDPAQAAPGTIRADFASNIEANAVHGSDSAQSAAREVRFFFKDLCGGESVQAAA